MNLESWITVWTWVYAIGLGSFLVIALAIVPLGARDVWRMLRAVEASRDIGTAREEDS
jgi:hypothetical protein